MGRERPRRQASGRRIQPALTKRPGLKRIRVASRQHPHKAGAAKPVSGPQIVGASPLANCPEPPRASLLRVQARSHQNQNISQSLWERACSRIASRHLVPASFACRHAHKIQLSLAVGLFATPLQRRLNFTVYRQMDQGPQSRWSSFVNLSHRINPSLTDTKVLMGQACRASGSQG